MAPKPVLAVIQNRTVLAENSDGARMLHKRGFGSARKDGRIILGAFEAFFLAEEGEIGVQTKSARQVSSESLFSILGKGDREFRTKYVVFRDLTEKGYAVKTGLKFGSDFRVYGKGAKAGQEHAKWIVFPVQERKSLTWQEFSAKNRVAHAARKNLLIAVVDDEEDVSYWEVSWLRP